MSPMCRCALLVSARSRACVGDPSALRKRGSQASEMAITARNWSITSRQRIRIERASSSVSGAKLSISASIRPKARSVRDLQV